MHYQFFAVSLKYRKTVKDMKNAAQEFINAMFNEARANGVDLSTEELQRAYFAANKTKWAYALLASK